MKVAEAELALAEEEQTAAKAQGPSGKLAMRRAELDMFRAKIAIETRPATA